MLVPAFSLGEDLYAAVMGTVAVLLPVVVPVFLLPIAGIAVWTASRKPRFDPVPDPVSNEVRLPHGSGQPQP